MGMLKKRCSYSLSSPAWKNVELIDPTARCLQRCCEHGHNAATFFPDHNAANWQQAIANPIANGGLRIRRRREGKKSASSLDKNSCDLFSVVNYVCGTNHIEFRQSPRANGGVSQSAVLVTSKRPLEIRTYSAVKVASVDDWRRQWVPGCLRCFHYGPLHPEPRCV
jgi:hypothetical protein